MQRIVIFFSLQSLDRPRSRSSSPKLGWLVSLSLLRCTIRPFARFWTRCAVVWSLWVSNRAMARLYVSCFQIWSTIARPLYLAPKRLLYIRSCTRLIIWTRLNSFGTRKLLIILRYGQNKKHVSQTESFFGFDQVQEIKKKYLLTLLF